jgi:Protein of unknown function (DUF3105)
MHTLKIVCPATALLTLLVAGCPRTTDMIGDPVDLGVEIAVASEGNTHFATGTDLTYDANPPASGPHWPTPAAAGYYDSAVPVEQWVHNLEHGYVVVLYDCRGDCDGQLLADLEAFAADAPASATFGFAKVIVTPYDGLPSNATLAAIAWEVELFLADFDAGALRTFFDKYQDQGPELAP